MQREQITWNHIKYSIKVTEGRRKGFGERKKIYKRGEYKTSYINNNLHMNGLNILLERQRLLEWMKWPMLALGQEVVSLEHLSVPESREPLCEQNIHDDVMCQRDRATNRRAPNGQS